MRNQQPDFYTSEFFQGISAGSEASASTIVPLLCSLFRPRSVLDVGCGTGLWLSMFSAHGVQDIAGVDGPWVDQSQLQIDPVHFREADLTRPPTPSRTFDLVISLEVAEHLPKAASEQFVEYLTSHAEIVIFSAAIPFQGGVNHINEQWPDYWSRHFATHDYVPLDLIRPVIWLEPNVEWWYRQNTVVYAAQSWAETHGFEPTEVLLPLVHPEQFLQRVHNDSRDGTYREWIEARPRLRSRLRRWLKAIRRRL